MVPQEEENLRSQKTRMRSLLSDHRYLANFEDFNHEYGGIYNSEFEYLEKKMNLLLTQKKNTQRENSGEEEMESSTSSVIFEPRSSVDPHNREEVNYLNIESTDRLEDDSNYHEEEEIEHPVELGFQDESNRGQIGATLDSKRSISFGSQQSIFSFKNAMNVMDFNKNARKENRESINELSFENSKEENKNRLKNKIKKKKNKSKLERKESRNRIFGLKGSEISNREEKKYFNTKNPIMRTNQSEDPEEILFNSKEKSLFTNTSLNTKIIPKMKKKRRVFQNRYQQKELKIKFIESEPIRMPLINQLCFIRLKPLIKNKPKKHPKITRKFEIERKDAACFREIKPQFWLNPPEGAISRISEGRRNRSIGGSNDSQKSIRTLKSGRKSNKKSIRLQRSRSFKSINSSNASSSHPRLPRAPLAQIPMTDNIISNRFNNMRNLHKMTLDTKESQEEEETYNLNFENEDFLRIPSNFINLERVENNLDLSHATSRINSISDNKRERILISYNEHRESLDCQIGFESAQTFGCGNQLKVLGNSTLSEESNQHERENIQVKANKRRRSKSRGKLKADSLKKLVDFSRNENKSKSKQNKRKKSVKNMLKKLKGKERSRSRNKNKSKIEKKKEEIEGKKSLEKTLKKRTTSKEFVNRKRIRRKGYKKSILDDVLKMQDEEIKGYFKKKRRVNIR